MYQDFFAPSRTFLFSSVIDIPECQMAEGSFYVIGSTTSVERVVERATNVQHWFLGV